jgi:hypothetical protein
LLSNENEEEKHKVRRIEERNCYQFFFFLLKEEMTNTGGSSRAAGLQLPLPPFERSVRGRTERRRWEQDRGGAQEERPAT